MIKKTIDNTLENVDYFIVDWKGTNSEDKKHLIPLLEEFEIKTSWSSSEKSFNYHYHSFLLLYLYSYFALKK